MNIFEYIRLDAAFYVYAFVGTFIFVVQAVMLFLGLASDDSDSSVTSAAALSTSNIYPGDTFRFISVHTVTGFFMVAGWTGLICYLWFKCNAIISIAVACMVGIAGMYAVTRLVTVLRRLGNSGHMFDVEKIIGKEATVYQTIDPDTGGKINISLEGTILSAVDAKSVDNTAINTFEIVTIVNVIDNNTVVVEKNKPDF